MVHLHTCTNQLRTSAEFYERLGFTALSVDSKNQFYTDGQVVVEINPDRFARPGLKLYRTDWQAVIESLQKEATPHKYENGYLITDPNGIFVYLEEGEPPIFDDGPEIAPSLAGNFAGLSLESGEMVRTFRFWNCLGYEITHGGPEKPWMTLSNGSAVQVSVMRPQSCPHLFFNPSFTYFNGANNVAIIDKIREAGIDLTEEITYFNTEGIVDNIIIRDPGGYGFFIFND